MRNIFFLLITVLCLQACKEDNEEVWVPDSLTIALSGDLISGGEAFNAGDGNWGINIAPDSEGTLKLDINTDQPWTISIDNITVEDEEWITASAQQGNGKSSVDIKVDANIIPEYRKASIVIATQGKIPVYKKITIIQKNMGVLNVTWNKKLLFEEDEMVFGPNQRQGIVIGTYESEGDEVESSLSSGITWANVKAENGQILLDLNSYADVDHVESHFTTVTLTNLNGGITRSIKVTQYASEDLTAKSTWSIEAGNDKTTYNNDNESFQKIIDGDINTHWQWNWRSAALSDFPNTPYEFIIDLGSSQLFNTFFVYQTQKADNGYVKDVRFKVSDDKSEWIDLGIFRMSDSSDAAIANGANPYTYALPGVYKMRYIRLMILSNVGDSKVNTPKNAYLGEFSAYLK